MSIPRPRSVALVSAPDADPFAQPPGSPPAAYPARYGGRTLEAYRDDLRTFFQWCADVGLDVLEARSPRARCSSSRCCARNATRPPTPRTASRRQSSNCVTVVPADCVTLPAIGGRGLRLNICHKRPISSGLPDGSIEISRLLHLDADFDPGVRSRPLWSWRPSDRDRRRRRQLHRPKRTSGAP